MDAEIFLNCFRNALPLVNPHYYGIELWSDEVLDLMGIGENQPEIDKIMRYLSRYGERAFCYELYHQTRKLMENYYDENPHPPDQPPVFLQAELKKSQIQDIVNFLPGLDVPLSKEFIPDFILHAPGPYERQEVVVEVKSNPKLTFGEIKNDIAKLQEFIIKYNYTLGIFLSINVNPIHIVNILKEENNQTWIDENVHNKEVILLIIKESQDTQPIEFSLNELPPNLD